MTKLYSWFFFLLLSNILHGNPLRVDSTYVDIFPLAIGNQWEYTYDHEYRDFNAVLNNFSDTGTVVIKIYDKITSLDSTRWLIEEIGDHWTKWNDLPWVGPQSQVDSFEIVEFNSGNHLLYRTGESSTARYSVIPFLYNLVDSAKINRYSFVDDSGKKVIYSQDSLTPNLFQFTFSKNVGLSTVSMSDGCLCLPYFWTHHTLRYSILTGVKDFTNTNRNLEYQLYQNFPNPFNPSTSFSFIIPDRSFVSLKVFDLVGREVSTIVAEELQGGIHNRIWNASGVASGIYFYRLHAGRYSETRKLLLLK